MSDAEGSGPPLPRNISVRRVNVDQATTRNMTVERFSSSTGESVGANEDLLVEVWNAVDEQTRTLKRSLFDVENAVTDITNAIRKQQTNDNKNAMHLRTQINTLTQAVRNLTGVSGGGGGGGNAASPPSSGGSSAEDAPIDAIHELRRTMEVSATQIVNELRRTLEVSATQIANSSGADGGEGGGGGGRDFADVRAAEAQIEGFREIMDHTRLTKIVKDEITGRKMLIRAIDDERGIVERLTERFTALVESGFWTTFQENMDRFNLKVQHVAESMTAFENISAYATNQFDTYMQMSTAGLSSFYEVMLEDFMPAIIHGGDSLRSTFETIRSSVETGLISPIGFFGEDVREVADVFRRAREGILDQRFNFYARMGFEEANQAMVSLYDAYRRESIRTDIMASQTQARMAREMEFLDVIAQNTGTSAEELVKMSREDRKEVSELVNAGILTAQRGQNLQRMITQLRGTGREGMANMLLDIARQGGSVEAYLAQNPEIAQGFAASNNIGNLRVMVDYAMSNRAGMSEQAQMSALDRITAGFNLNNPQLGVAGAQVLSQTVRQILGEGGLSRERYRRDEETEDDTFAEFARQVDDFFSNIFPKASAMMATALVANTFAIFLNTKALMGTRVAIHALSGFPGGGGTGAGAAAGAAGAGASSGGIRGRIGRMFSGLGRGAGAAGRGLGGLARGAGRVVGSVGKKIPGLGLLIGAGLGLNALLSGDALAAGGHLASGVASMVPGIGTAASIGIDSALMAREMNKTPEQSNVVSPTSVGQNTNTVTGAGANTSAMRYMRMQKDLLMEIRDLLDESNSINNDIKSNTNRIGIANRGLIGSIFQGLEDTIDAFS